MIGTEVEQCRYECHPCFSPLAYPLYAHFLFDTCRYKEYYNW
jgi:hypothetical protein